MTRIDSYATAQEIQELATRYTIEDVRGAVGTGGGWYRLPDGFIVGFDFLRAVVEQWLNQRGGIYLRTEGPYDAPVVHVGVAPVIDPVTQRQGPYGGLYPQANQIRREDWSQVTHGMTAGMVREDDDDNELGNGEDHGDNVREHAETWGLR